MTVPSQVISFGGWGKWTLWAILGIWVVAGSEVSWSLQLLFYPGLQQGRQSLALSSFSKEAALLKSDHLLGVKLA